MKVRTITQPQLQLGAEIDGLLSEARKYTRVVLVSAFVALRTILRLRKRLLAQKQTGAKLQLTIGIDLGGTSREVLEELLKWDCEVYIFHNAIGRATFHPKIYLFEDSKNATLFVGSNNLTDGGFYTNYEAGVRWDFSLPADGGEYNKVTDSLKIFLKPTGETVQPLTKKLVEVLVARNDIPSEAEARGNRRERARAKKPPVGGAPENPFAAVKVPLPPLLERALRISEPSEPDEPSIIKPPAPEPVSKGLLVWRKKLSPSDVSALPPPANPKDLVVLSQAKFEGPDGQPIKQATYFRNLFRDLFWEPEPGKHTDQEHAYGRFRIVIRGHDLGMFELEISHKPTGEANQANSPTVIRWGKLMPIIRKANLAGGIFSLYELTDSNADFLIEIA